MAEESLQLPPEHNLDYHIVSLFERLENLRKEQNQGAVLVVGGRVSRPSMQAEIRTLEFWSSSNSSRVNQYKNYISLKHNFLPIYNLFVHTSLII
uniref:Uncharacterized protein n=1 Tax=Lutzomyia longipalpis TaxID=7200 RepID=A0A1B0GI09_LUTLO